MGLSQYLVLGSESRLPSGRPKRPLEDPFAGAAPPPTGVACGGGEGVPETKVKSMNRGKRLLAACALLIAGINVVGCAGPACDTAMRYNTLVLDSSSLPEPVTGLDLVISRPGRDLNACTLEPSGKRFDLASERSVLVDPSVQAIHAVVYKKGAQSVVAEADMNPVPWDPPRKPNTCATPAKATLTL